MTIRYANGLTKESVLLSRTQNSLRVAIEGCDDVTEIHQVNGTWVTDECEPVQVTFAWEFNPAAEVTEADCICPPEIAASLIRLLYHPEDEIAAVRSGAPVDRELLSPLVV